MRVCVEGKGGAGEREGGREEDGRMEMNQWTYLSRHSGTILLRRSSATRGGGEGRWRRGFWSVPIIVARTLAIFRGFFASSTAWLNHYWTELFNWSTNVGTSTYLGYS